MPWGVQRDCWKGALLLSLQGPPQPPCRLPVLSPFHSSQPPASASASLAIPWTRPLGSPLSRHPGSQRFSPPLLLCYSIPSLGPGLSQQPPKPTLDPAARGPICSEAAQAACAEQTARPWTQVHRPPWPAPHPSTALPSDTFLPISRTFHSRHAFTLGPPTSKRLASSLL